jgi:DNA-directed RNA polymerase alpha subunit
MQNKLEACCCKIVGLSFLCPSQQNITDTADINSYVISQRLKNIIKSMGIISLSQFSEFNLWDFLKQRNFGKKTLEELERFLQNNNIKLKEREIEQSQLVYVFPQWYDNYQLSGRFINVLRQLEINSLHHLSNITFEQFAFSRNVGKTTIDELIQLLHQTGIQIKAINHPVVNLSYNKEFRLRTYYALKNIVDDHSITHLSQLSNYSESYFLKLGGRGKTGVAELKQLLLHNGIKLKEE